MMTWMWKNISKQGWSNSIKQTLFIGCSVLAFCVLGFLLWLLVKKLIGDDIVWMLCFMGYPGFFFGYLGAIFYLWKEHT